MTTDSFIFHGHDDAMVRLGDGISRPAPGAKTRQIKMRVYIDKGLPLTLTMQAESMKKAREYALNRWPHAIKIEYVRGAK